MNQGNRRAILAALSANLGIAIAKFIGYVVTGAASLLAEGVHSVADTGNQALLLWGGTSARRVATPEHPFGYGRERYFWSFVVALVIFSLGSLFAIYEGITKLGEPHVISDPSWAIGILLVGLLLEGFSFRMAVHEARLSKGDASWWTFIRRTKSPELPVVLLEDLGALCGLTIALTGIALAVVFDEPRFDALGSVAIGLLLGCIACLLAVEMKSLLIGEAATAADQARIRERVLVAQDVRRLIHLRTQHLGPDQLLVAAKVEFDEQLSFRELADSIDVIEASIRESLPVAAIIYIEPDIYDPEQDTGA